jgi:peptidoglycan/LPS O-acetylase OafA/YrhL
MEKRPSLDSLTSLRFFAAALIVLLHSKDSFELTRGDWPYQLAYGVSFFFVLSGFILAYVYAEGRPGFSIRDFYVSRIARIWPLHVVTLVSFVLLMPAEAWTISGSDFARVFMANLLLLHAMIPNAEFNFSFNAVSWSISAELFFYIAFPLLASRWNERWLRHAAIAFIGIAAWLAYADLIHVSRFSGSNIFAMTTTSVAFISPFSRIAEFITGMIAARLFFASRVWFAWAWAVPHWLYRGDTQGFYSTATCYFLFTCGAAPAFGVLIACIANQRGFISRALTFRPLVILGDASFALYLTHLLSLRWFLNHRFYFSSFPDSIQLAGYWAFVIALSLVVGAVVERPARKVIVKAFARKAETASTLVGAADH